MSDLGRLFRLRSAPDLEPLENFTTVALAIAIGHDDRPIKQALREVDWTYDNAKGSQALATFAVADIVSVTAETQRTLWANKDIPPGYLDLVLHVLDAQQRHSEIWFEVKVDAWEHGSQLENYKRHAALSPRSPTIITLARMRVSPLVPALKWLDIVDAVASVPNPHHTWLSLREFLLDEKIVRPPVPTEPADARACIDVIVDVNRRLAELWPNSGTLVWREGTLRNSLERSFEAHRDLVTSGGPLRYGLMPAGERWEWGLVVTTRNYQKVPLDAHEMLRDAEVGGLPQEWMRHTDRFEVLARRLSPGRPVSHDEIVAWFDEGLRQLHHAKVLDPFLAGLSTRQTVVVERAREIDATDEHE
jgi:hypothetical protein